MRYGFVRAVFLLLLLFGLAALPGCSSSGHSGDHEDTARPVGQTDLAHDPLAFNLVAFYTSCRSITVHVAYEPDALPYTGVTEKGMEYWSILESNLYALFFGRIIQPDISVPKDLAHMEQIQEQGRQSWTQEQIIALASSIWDTPQTVTSAELYALFINGYFRDDEGVHQNIIGLSLGGIPVVAIFKDVIALSGFTQVMNSFMEQAVLVHEFGHAAGLVNNGVPMVSAHEDLEHPRHCVNEDCVMYWENERDNLIFFIHRIVSTDSLIVFDENCLQDANSWLQ